MIKDIQHYLQKDAFEISAQFTLMTLLFNQVGNNFSRPFILFFAALAILLVNGFKQRFIWITLFFFTSFRVVYEWPMADNHAYLLALWCLVLLVSCNNNLKEKIIANNARILIGLVFLLACIQKILSPDYLDGTFFQYLLLTDNRFEDFTVLFSDITYQQIDNARELLGLYQFSSFSSEKNIVPDSSSFRILVLSATWWNLIDQLAVACCFLAPNNSFLNRKRDVSLLVFCLTTYAVAPVPGFGWLLVSMALAQCRNNSNIRIAYICTFFIILFYSNVYIWGLLADFFT